MDRMISNSDDSIKKIEQGDLMEDDRGLGGSYFTESGQEGPP